MRTRASGPTGLSIANQAIRRSTILHGGSCKTLDAGIKAPASHVAMKASPVSYRACHSTEVSKTGVAMSNGRHLMILDGKVVS